MTFQEGDVCVVTSRHMIGSGHRVRQPAIDPIPVDTEVTYVGSQNHGNHFVLDPWGNRRIIHESCLTKEETESEENNMTFQEGDIYVVTSPHLIGSTPASNPLPVGTEVTYRCGRGRDNHSVLDPQGNYRVIHESCLTKKENTMPTMTRPAPYNPDTVRPLEERLAAWPAADQPVPERRARVTMLSSFEEYSDLEWLSGEVTVHLIDRHDPDRLFRVLPADNPDGHSHLDFQAGSFAWVADVEPVETQVSTPEEDPSDTLRGEQAALVAELQAAKERFEERQREIVRMAMAAGESSGEEDSVRAALELCCLGHLVEELEPEEVRGVARVTVTFDVDVTFQREDMEARDESPEEFLQASIDGLTLSFDGDVDEGSDSYSVDSVSFTQY